MPLLLLYLLNDSASDRHVAGERALLVNVVSLNSLLRGLESQTDVFPVSNALGRFLGQKFLGIQEKGILLLKGFLNLL